ncbi:TRAP transporter substrate-binding protein [Bacillus sp. FJAT-29814]|uniref:TRAP transporter substrate-binding protein n=1 Tax=Bacillus sp. FJAT-29814 TaxID=1729688 RepID=UPI00083576B1|nr:TRAP transporter substrate-binding protein DctP [Bacillus sp. FJAT-29814]
MKNRTKGSLYSFAAIILALSMILTACGGNQTSSTSNAKGNGNKTGGKSTELIFGIAVPASHVINVKGIEPWAEKVKQETNGSATINIQAGGVLGGTKTVIQDVSGGVYDIGLAVGKFFPDSPLFKSTVLDLPFLFSKSDDHLLKAKIAKKFMEKYLEEDLKKLGVKIVSIYLSDPAVLASTKPIRTVEDLKGKKTQFDLPSYEPLFKSWGAVPVSMAIEDIYSGLEKGTMDVAIYAFGGMYSQKFYEPAPYITNLPVSNSVQAVIMNQAKWDSLSPETQKKFDESLDANLEEALNVAYADGAKESKEKIKAELKGKGEIIELSPKELAKFTAPAEAVWKEWIKEADKKGYDGKKLVDGVLKIMEEEGLEPPFEFKN